MDRNQLSLLLLMIYVLFVPTVEAQITTDGTVGAARALSGPNYRIGSDLGKQVGSNLFHSFGKFNINNGESATFTGPNAIANIIGRITGGTTSSIDGLLRSTIQDANLFLINPSGVMFGPNAALDVNGSFHVSTADYLRLSDGGVFYADPAWNSVLTVAPPSAFGFLGNNPASISIEGSSLEVPKGETLSVVAGDISINDGTLDAPSGRINLASVGSQGEVTLYASGLGVDTFENFGIIEISNHSYVNVSGDPGGTVVIRGGRLNIEQSDIVANTIRDANGADISIDISVSHDISIENESQIQAGTYTNGDSGNIRIRSNELRLAQGSEIFSFSAGVGEKTPEGDILWTGKGKAGDIILETDRTITNEGGQIKNQTYGDGPAGDIILETDRIIINEGGQITNQAFGIGSCGDISIRAAEFVTINQKSKTRLSGVGTMTYGSGTGGSVTISTAVLNMDDGFLRATSHDEGNAGDIVLSVDRLVFSGGAETTTNSYGEGKGGDISITAKDLVSIAGENDEGYRSAVFSSAEGIGDGGSIVISTPALRMNVGSLEAITKGDGHAGSIVIQVDRLHLREGAFIDTNSYGAGSGGDIHIEATEEISMDDGYIHSWTTGRGKAGTIQLDVKRLTLTGGSRVDTHSNGEGQGGNLSITAEELNINNGFLQTYTIDEGDAGDILLEVGNLSVIGGASINSSSDGGGHGGEIVINAAESISISGRDETGYKAEVISNALGSGEAGKISISTPELKINDGLIQAATTGAADAGEVLLMAERVYLADGAQIVTATLGSGRGGKVFIKASGVISVSGKDKDGHPSGVFSGAKKRGQGGDIELRAKDVQLNNGGHVSSSSDGTSNAGGIIIDAGNLSIKGNSFLKTEAKAADGGNININTYATVYLADSTLSASVGGGSQTVGGNINIASEHIALNRSSIIANAYEGKGGNIQIVADTFLSDPSSDVSASSELGIEGTVEINAPDVNITGIQVPLPKVVFSAADLLQDPCIARLKSGEASTFIISGRDGLPIMPGKLLPSPVFQEKIAEKEKRDSF